MYVCSYSISDSKGRMEELLNDEVSINVRSFGGSAVIVRVGKKEGMESEQLLEDTSGEPSPGAKEGENLWSTLSK